MLRKLIQTFNTDSLRHTVLLCVVLFVLNVCYAIPLLAQPMDTETDAYGRARVYDFLGSGVFVMQGSVWLPLYQTFMATTNFLPGGEIMTPRYLALLASSVVPVLIFLLTKHLTKRSDVSFFTALLTIIFPLFREIGAVTLSETFFLALFLGAIYCLLRQWHVGFGSLLLLSQMTRFETWFVIPWFALIFATQKKLSTVARFVLIAACVVFPLFYSTLSYLNHGTGAQYLTEMSGLARLGHVPGQDNWPLALSEWNRKIWEVYPISFAVLFVVGLQSLVRQKQNAKTDDGIAQFVYAVLPLFLVLMLPIQLFSSLRDWLPTRYLLIPTILMMPLMGNGLAYVSKTYSWRRWWLWYVLGGLFLVFELYSFQLRTHRLISTYSATQFQELQQTLDQPIRALITENPTLKIYIASPKSFTTELPEVNIEFVRYFLFPQKPEIAYIPESDLPTLLATDPAPKIIIATTLQQFPNIPNQNLFFGESYQFFMTQ